MDVPNLTLLSDILAQLHTKAEADHFLTQIDIVSESLFSNKAPLKEKMDESFPSDIVLSFLNALKAAAIDEKDVIGIQHFFEELKTAIKQIPIINITIAFNPKQQTILKIHNWCTLHLKTHILLNIKVERQIIGGAILEYQGKYFEYSIHKAMEEKLALLSNTQKSNPESVQ